MEQKIGVLFDMDGVIVDSNPWHRKSLDVFFKKYGLQLNDDELHAKVFGRANKDWIPDMMKTDLSPTEIRSYSEEKEQIYRDLYGATIEPLPGLESFLDQFKAGYRRLPVKCSGRFKCRDEGHWCDNYVSRKGIN